MPVPLDRNLPLVVICNISETFFDFLNRAEDEQASARLISGEQFRGDRALLWLGDPKLVFVTYPIPHAEHLCQQLGYRATRYLAPANPSPWLSLDILREPALRQAIVDYAGRARSLQLVPYATTPQFLELVQVLRKEYGLQVLLPESPAPDSLWLRDYIDTKAGFRILASRWLPDVDRLPLGIICHDRQQAADVAYWFNVNGQTCVLKADIGENGIGNYVLPPGRFASARAIADDLQHNTFLRGGPITVEEFIPSGTMLSPSLEMYVPPLGQGAPEITYLSRQMFLEYGDFCGVLVSRELQQTPWYPVLAECGRTLAGRLQSMGYVGHFDIDAVVDDQQRVYLLEVNSRRTGGTHVHELATFVYGPDYLDRVVLLSHDALPSGHLTNYADLRAAIGDMLYPMQGAERGVIVTGTSALAAREFGTVIVAATTDEALALQRALLQRIQAAVPTHLPSLSESIDQPSLEQHG